MLEQGSRGQRREKCQNVGEKREMEKSVVEGCTFVAESLSVRRKRARHHAVVNGRKRE